MASTLSDRPTAAHRFLPEKAVRSVAKAHLKEIETPDYRAVIGRCIDRARCLVGWSKKELAAALGKDEGQVCRWIDGKERPQLDALIAVDALRGPMVIALAELTNEIEVTTQITVRRSA